MGLGPLTLSYDSKQVIYVTFPLHTFAFICNAPGMANLIFESSSNGQCLHAGYRNVLTDLCQLLEKRFAVFAQKKMAQTMSHPVCYSLPVSCIWQFCGKIQLIKQTTFGLWLHHVTAYTVYVRQ